METGQRCRRHCLFSEELLQSLIQKLLFRFLRPLLSLLSFE